MKKYYWPVLSLIAMCCYSCGPGAGPVQRKELPALTDSRTEGSFSPGLPFQVAYTDLQTAGRTETFWSVALPDAAEDSAVFNLVNTYKPLAVTMLTAWSKQSHKGVLIDLRSGNSQEQHRADYSIECGETVYIPVVFMWDNYSLARAATFMDLLQSSPALKVNRLSTDHHSGLRGTDDCFSSNPPSFDHP